MLGAAVCGGMGFLKSSSEGTSVKRRGFGGISESMLADYSHLLLDLGSLVIDVRGEVTVYRGSFFWPKTLWELNARMTDI